MTVAVYMTQRHMSGGNGHEHIAEVKWENRATGASGQATRATMVDWIKNKGGDARVANGSSYVSVGVVEASTPYIRTYADGVWTDNLLSLPTY
jgi:exosome complex RNA-binding protein Rrp42 (RNase PH superfamily)